MNNIYDILSLMLLTSSIVLITNKRALSYIRTFQVQSIIIIVGALIMSANNHHIDLLIVSAIMLFLKVIYIPRYLRSTHNKVNHEIHKDFYLNIPILSFIACLLVAIVYLTISGIPLISAKDITTPLTCNLSIIFIGLLFMISRKDAIGQIIGFLVIENGLFSTALFTTHGMPLIIDLGIFIDLLTAIIIMSMILYYEKRQDRKDGLIFKITALSFLFVPLGFIAQLIARIGMYLQVSMIATYPLMIRTINNRIVRAGTLFIIMFFTIYDFFSFFNSEIWRDSFIEYHTIFESFIWR